MARRTRKSAEERFWEKVQKGPGCWTWLGGTVHGGYGHLKVAGRYIRAPRFSYTLEHGVDIAPGLVVCHRCDNPACVNPAHLYLGTLRDNQQDRRVKGRHGDQRHKLTPEQREEMVARAMFPGANKSALAREYGVTVENVCQLVRNRRRTEMGIAA